MKGVRRKVGLVSAIPTNQVEIIFIQVNEIMFSQIFSLSLNKQCYFDIPA